MQSMSATGRGRLHAAGYAVTVSGFAEGTTAVEFNSDDQLDDDGRR
jgi:hypothetical protein